MCGTMSNLEVHHKEFRSHSGGDSEENLITLCSACHANVHEGIVADVILHRVDANNSALLLVKVR